MISSGAHLRRHVIDRRRHHAGEGRERNAEAVGERDHARHIDAEGAHQGRVFGRGAQVGAKPRALDHEPGPDADRKRRHDHPGAIVRQEHETEILAALQRFRHGIGQTRRAEIIARDAFEDERQTERQQQAIEMVELVEPLQEQTLDDDAGDADQDGRDDQRRPIAEAGVLQDEIGGKRAHHVLGAVAEIDDVEHAEDDGQPQAEQRVKRAVDQADQQLSEQRLRRNAEDLEHGRVPLAEKGGRSPPFIIIRSAADQRATAVLRIAEGILGRDGGLGL